MPIVESTTIDEVSKGRLSGHLKRIEGIKSNNGRDTYRTDFRDVQAGEYVMDISEEGNYNTFSMDIRTILELFNLFNLTDGPEETFNAIIEDEEWINDTDLFEEIDEYNQDGASCRFCGDHGKRTTELFCDVPDRDEYSNGWTHPVVQYGKIGPHGFHEDCLSLAVGFAYELYKENKDTFMAITV